LSATRRESAHKHAPSRLAAGARATSRSQKHVYFRALSTTLQPGIRINQYEIIKMIGESGMGSVFLARDLRLGRRVAIKFLRSTEPEQTQ
jgi:serine/threonine protein kinase